MWHTIDVEIEDGVLLLRATPWGRLLAGAERGVVWGGVGLCGLLVIFSPDVLVDMIWGRVEGSPSVSLLILSMAGLAAMIGMIGAAVRALRRDLWAFDATRGVLQFQTAPLLGSPVRQRVQLSAIENVVVVEASWWQTSRICVRFEDARPVEVLAAGRFAGADVDRVGRELEEFLVDHGLDGDIPVIDKSDSLQE